MATETRFIKETTPTEAAEWHLDAIGAPSSELLGRAAGTSEALYLLEAHEGWQDEDTCSLSLVRRGGAHSTIERDVEFELRRTPDDMLVRADVDDSGLDWSPTTRKAFVRAVEARCREAGGTRVELDTYHSHSLTLPLVEAGWEQTPGVDEVLEYGIPEVIPSQDALAGALAEVGISINKLDGHELFDIQERVITKICDFANFDEWRDQAATQGYDPWDLFGERPSALLAELTQPGGPRALLDDIARWSFPASDTFFFLRRLRSPQEWCQMSVQIEGDEEPLEIPFGRHMFTSVPATLEHAL